MASRAALAQMDAVAHQQLMAVVRALAPHFGLHNELDALDGLHLQTRNPEYTAVEERRIIVKILRVIARRVDPILGLGADDSVPDATTPETEPAAQLVGTPDAATEAPAAIPARVPAPVPPVLPPSRPVRGRSNG